MNFGMVYPIVRAKVEKFFSNPYRRVAFYVVLSLLVLTIALAPTYLVAQTGATAAFNNFWVVLSSWFAGPLGKALAVIIFIVGIFGGIAGRLDVLIVSFIISFLVAMAPKIIDSFFA